MRAPRSPISTLRAYLHVLELLRCVCLSSGHGTILSSTRHVMGDPSPEVDATAKHSPDGTCHPKRHARRFVLWHAFQVASSGETVARPAMCIALIRADAGTRTLHSDMARSASFRP